MVRAARILLAVPALAFGAAPAWPQATPPRLSITYDAPAPSIQGPPSTRFDISLVGKDGKDVGVRAQTDAFGATELRYAPPGAFAPAAPARSGSLTLPDQGFGTIEYGGAGGLAREPIATWGGKAVTPERFALNVVSPFSLLCRSDEGPPQSLATGDRYSFEVPGPSAALTAVLSDPRATGTHWFALPGGQGFSASVGAGKDPAATWRWLQGLMQAGRIARLERDPCWRFLPEGSPPAACNPGERDFPDKAVRLPITLESLLRDAAQMTAIDGAAVLVGPLPPTPFVDPGPRPGDEKPPTLTTTGADGRYAMPVGTMAGPVEIGVAKGCDEHTTVAMGPATVASAPDVVTAPGYFAPPTVVRGTPVPAPATVTREPPKTPAVQPPTFAQRKPEKDEPVCGPDVTDYLLGLLQSMVEWYSQQSAEGQAKACSALYGLQFNGAWDMTNFAPADSNREKDEYLWWGRMFPDVCARPKYPCGATVEFLGQCLDTQIVNYVQWGAVNQLCGTVERGRLAHTARTVALGVFSGRAPWSESPVYDAQDAMSMVGERWAGGSGNLRDRKERVEGFLRRWIALRPAIGKTDGFACPRTCGTYVPDAQRKAKFDGLEWGFRWGAGRENWWNTTTGAKLPKP